MTRRSAHGAADEQARADKATLLVELVAHLRVALAAATEAHEAAVAGATHAEARAENDKDTRALEQTYLARGQAQRVAELEGVLADLARWAPRTFGAGDAAALGALVTVEEDAQPRRLWLAPAGGGQTLAGGVQVVTPSSPLGRALLGKRVGDTAVVRAAGRERELEIIAVA